MVEQQQQDLTVQDILHMYSVKLDVHYHVQQLDNMELQVEFQEAKHNQVT
jgi:hypothetical protein